MSESIDGRNCSVSGTASLTERPDLSETLVHEIRS